MEEIYLKRNVNELYQVFVSFYTLFLRAFPLKLIKEILTIHGYSEE
jgi:hypothetical protein